jgi:multidrug transporter EmrE-like cation transporter
MTRSNKYIGYIFGFALAICIVEAFAQYNIKKSSDKKKPFNVLKSALLYAIICFLLYNAYCYENVGHMNLIWSCMSIITAFTVGYICFNEPFNCYTCIAILSACLAIYFSHIADGV